MTGLAIYMSNRTELLAEQLADVLSVPPDSPLSPEIIVVQSSGMQRWLSLRLANHNRICANIQFPFPKTFLTQMAARLASGQIVSGDDDSGLVTFSLMRLLPQHLHRPDFKRLRNYLLDDPYGLKLFQLCQKIAFLFDQYTVYRPEILKRWERGPAESDSDARWQAWLWRHLVKETEPETQMSWLQALSAAIGDNPQTARRLPARAAIFGISYLPPLYLQLFSELSRVMQLNLFWMNPSREYWGDIVSDRQALHLQRRADQPGADLHLESGNRLLAAFGTLGRNFMKMLIDCNSLIHEHYAAPSDSTVLSRLQADILDLRDRVGGVLAPHASAAANFRKALVADRIDSSIQVHSCHSPLREMDVLHDNLLALLEADSGLMPSDIIVMAPDIETYAPYIQAVFGTQTDPNATIPFSIADRSPGHESSVVDGFMALMEIRDSRFEALRIVRLLEYPGIKERFGLDQTDLVQIEHWVRQSQIRWGVDARSREQAGVPGFKENTWSEGFRRLLLGYAMPSEEKTLFGGILPYDHIEGSETVTLGNFIEFVTRLIDLQTQLDEPKPMSLWRSVLADVLTQFFSVDTDHHRDVQIIRQIIAGLAETAARARFEDAVDLAFIRAWFKGQLRTVGGAAGFLGQGVTFCALLPMRSIPFKVVCLVGMDNAAFPRDSQPMEFDLMAREPRPGDRSRRDDDRYLFLEALLSAREAFYISYVGQNIQDNSPIPPSVLVRELLDTLDSKADQSDALTINHRLQPFSAAYFRDDTHLFSYSAENMAVCARGNEPPSQAPFIGSRLTLTETETHIWQELDLEKLALFWHHPCRFLLRQRLGIYLENDETLLPDSERFKLDALEHHQLGQTLLQQRLEHRASPEPYTLLAASGQLPPVNAGRLAYDQLVGEVNSMVESLKGSPLESDPIRLDIEYRYGEVRLSGTVPQAHQGGCVSARFAKTKARDLLQNWIYHLGYGIAAAPVGPTSYLFCRDNSWQLNPVSDSAALLSDLIELFRTGLTAPLAFVPQSSYAYAEAVLKRNQSDQAALQAALRIWRGTDYARGEAEDPYVSLFFRDRDPMSDEFRALALRVFEPLFDHLQQIGDGYGHFRTVNQSD